MAYIVQDILIEALSLIGVVNGAEIPSASDLNTAMLSANFMIDSWSANNLMLRATILESFPLTINQSSYTIGAGGNFNTVKPIKIYNAFLQDNTGNRYDLEVIGKDLYDSYEDSQISTGLPSAICFDPGASQQGGQMGTIFVYCIPSLAYTLYMEQQKYLTEFASLAAPVGFEPAYYAALSWNLAEWVFYKFRSLKSPIPPLIVKMARQTKRAIETINSNPRQMSTDLPTAKAQNYNIYSDQFS